MDLVRARDVHLNDASALYHEYERGYLPHGYTLKTTRVMRHIYYTVWHRSSLVFRAIYQLDADELTDVRTNPKYRGRGIARLMLSIILRADGPTVISAGPMPDSPLGLHQLIKFYSSFPGYHAVPGTNKVIRLMTDTRLDEEAGVELAGSNGDFGRKPKSTLQLSVLEQNSKELKRIMTILQPLNDAEVDKLLTTQQTDMLSLQNAMRIYDNAFFDSRPWGRAHRVMFAKGMADILARNTGMRCGTWDTIVEEESF